MKFVTVLSPSLILDIIKILYGILIGIIFMFAHELFSRYLEADKNTRTDAAYLAFLIIAYSLFGYGIYLILVLRNYGLVTGIERTDASTAVQVFLLIIILTPMAIVCEKLLFKKNNAVVSVLVGTWIVNYTLILTLLEFVDPTLDMDLMFIPVYCSFGVLGVIDFLGFVLIFFKRLRTQKEITNKIKKTFISALIASIGAVIAIFGRQSLSVSYIIGTLIEIVGWLGIRYNLLQIPSYGEFEWRDGLNELYVIVENSGTTIHTKYFKSKPIMNEDGTQSLPDSELVGGGMIGIQAILEQIAKTNENIENVTIGNKHIFFIHGEFMLCVLVTDKKLGVYSGILTSLVREIEKSNPTLKDFNGEISRYQKSIKATIEQIFNPQTKKGGNTK